MANETPNNTNVTSTKLDGLKKVANLGWRGVVLLLLAILAVAGVLHLLSGVDKFISYPVAIVLVGLLTKEIL